MVNDSSNLFSRGQALHEHEFIAFPDSLLEEDAFGYSYTQGSYNSSIAGPENAGILGQTPHQAINSAVLPFGSSPVSAQPAPSRPSNDTRLPFGKSRQQKQDMFDIIPGSPYFSLVLVVVGICFTCPQPLHDSTLLHMINQLLGYGDPEKTRTFTPTDLEAYRSMYGHIGNDMDAWVDFLRLMWQDQERQLEWILSGLSKGFKHGADPSNGLDIEEYGDSHGVFTSRYLYPEGEVIHTNTVEVDDLRKILIDVIAEAVQCDVVRPGENHTDTWSNIKTPPVHNSRGKKEYRSRFEPNNHMPNYPDILGFENGRRFPYARERAQMTVGNLSLEQRMNVATILGIPVMPTHDPSAGMYGTLMSNQVQTQAPVNAYSRAPSVNTGQPIHDPSAGVSPQLLMNSPMQGSLSTHNPGPQSNANQPSHHPSARVTPRVVLDSPYHAQLYAYNPAAAAHTAQAPRHRASSLGKRRAYPQFASPIKRQALEPPLFNSNAEAGPSNAGRAAHRTTSFGDPHPSSPLRNIQNISDQVSPAHYRRSIGSNNSSPRNASLRLQDTHSHNHTSGNADDPNQDPSSSTTNNARETRSSRLIEAHTQAEPRSTGSRGSSSSRSRSRFRYGHNSNASLDPDASDSANASADRGNTNLVSPMPEMRANALQSVSESPKPQQDEQDERDEQEQGEFAESGSSSEEYSDDTGDGDYVDGLEEEAVEEGGFSNGSFLVAAG